MQRSAFVSYLVFAQADQPQVDVQKLADHARKFFRCSIQTTDAKGAIALDIALQSGVTARATLRARKASRDDHHAAREAEARGQVSGMGALADKCGWVWQVDFDDGAPQAAVFTACAALASVALGPVLPPDHSSLFGVRGAMERSAQGGEPYR